MRIYILILTILVLVTRVNGQEIKLKPFYEKRSSYILTENFEPFRKSVLDSICKEFNVIRTQNIGGNTFYNFKVGMSLYQFSVWDTKFKFDTTWKINQYEVNKTFSKGDSLCLRGFLVISAEGKKMSKKYSQILLSAFLQETNNTYLNEQGNFTVLPLKSNSEFWKRNFINMGYGMSYATKDNPFTSGRGLAVGFGYVWEALHYIPIFGGAFFGETQNDKVVIPIIGLSSLLVWKTIFYGLIIGQPTVKSYNRFATMKYKMPKTIID
jgi:hypothetical protein